MCVSTILPSFAARFSLATFSVTNVIYEDLHKVSSRGISVGTPLPAVPGLVSLISSVR
jgi:hypothetical protein